MHFLGVLVLALTPGIFWLWLIYRWDKYRPEPRAEKTSASQTISPLPSIHSVCRMGLTIHSCVTIH